MPDRPTVPLVVLPLLALAVAVLVGGGVGIVASAIAEPTGLAPARADASEDELVLISSVLTAGELARATGVRVGVAPAQLVWFIGLAWTAHRYFAQGRRAVPIALAVGAAWLGSALALVVLGAVRGTPPDLVASSVVAVVVAAVAGLVLPVWARRPQAREPEGLLPAQPVGALDGWLAAEP